MLAFLLAIMTALAIAVVGWPILRPRRAAPPPRREHDLAVYRDQLAELERDQNRGVLDASQVQAARLEIERRLLAAAKQQER
ncbi:MAG: c-type cytochrome biogenesis protein CcmI, partial [Rhodospirillales bacterium]